MCKSGACGLFDLDDGEKVPVFKGADGLRQKKFGDIRIVLTQSPDGQFRIYTGGGDSPDNQLAFVASDFDLEKIAAEMATTALGGCGYMFKRSTAEGRRKLRDDSRLTSSDIDAVRAAMAHNKSLSDVLGKRMPDEFQKAAAALLGG